MAKPLPPDPDQLNDDRAQWAAEALKSFQQQTGTDDDDALADLLADLQHWADRHDASFADALARADRYYRAETTAEEE